MISHLDCTGRVCEKDEKEGKKRGALCSQILLKATSTKDLLATVMNTPCYSSLPAPHKLRIEDHFRKLTQVESQAAACVHDNSKPLPDDVKSMSEMMHLQKAAKLEESKLMKLIVAMEKVLGGN